MELNLNNYFNNNLFNKNTNCTQFSVDLSKSLLYTFYSQKHKEYIKNKLVNDSEVVGLNEFINDKYLKLNDYLNMQMRENQNKLKEAKMSGSDLTLNDNNTTNLINTIDSCHRLLKLNKNRQLVKLPIMVKAYNASKLTIIDYLKEKFDKVFVNSKNNKDFLDSMNNIINNEDKVIFLDPTNKKTMLNNKDFVLLVNILEKVISNEFPKLNEFSLYLNEIAKICVNLNITISWP